MQGNCQWFNKSPHFIANRIRQPQQGVFRKDSVFSKSTVGGKSKGTEFGAHDVSTTLTVVAFAAIDEGIGNDPVVDLEVAGPVTRRNHLAGKLMAENNGSAESLR